ncbi:hypothetical protein EVAR_31843_1 [Eumeta japonica]|uniref:Uncharacterized protein n=1 Tax=Eumeta variegata TaxID=151549 RepID=A0A4C1WI88_EUMVA|nr:hypothetical protein EVAR_31843_1 [Eumeta japonica]
MDGSKSWVWQKKDEIRINAVKIRSMCGVSRKDRCRNSDVRERCGLKEDVTRVERGLGNHDCPIREERERMSCIHGIRQAGVCQSLGKSSEIWA